MSQGTWSVKSSHDTNGFDDRHQPGENGSPSEIRSLHGVGTHVDKTPNEQKRITMDVVDHEILQALKGLQFGEITITVREGRVVQIERVIRERQMLPKKKE